MTDNSLSFRTWHFYIFIGASISTLIALSEVYPKLKHIDTH
jgi:hypothetical protein